MNHSQESWRRFGERISFADREVEEKCIMEV